MTRLRDAPSPLAPLLGVARFLLIALPLTAACALAALRIGGGSVNVSWSELMTWLLGGEIDPLRAEVLGVVRLPRVLMALLAGAILASTGGVYQALLRNPLADPYTLGVSGGATLGAVLAIAARSLAVRLSDDPASSPVVAIMDRFPMLSLWALAGAVGTIILIHLVARIWGMTSTSTLILAGVTLNMIFGSLILLLEYFADYTQVYQMIRWMMGGLDVVGYGDFGPLVPLAAAAFAVQLLTMRDLDLVSVDPAAALTLGVNVVRLRWLLLISASLATGGAVALVGPIGFVGLIVPHCVRILLGASHFRVLPWSMVCGGVFLLACDLLAQNLLGEVELPVGIITSILGGPFFIWLLIRSGGGTRGWID